MKFSGVGPNRVRITGENNYMRLHSEENGPMTTRASRWRVLLSPGGPGVVGSFSCGPAIGE